VIEICPGVHGAVLVTGVTPLARRKVRMLSGPSA
jgi:hypothetical protein